MTPETGLEIEPQPARMSEGERLVAVFFEPKKAFADIVQRPGWVVPMILVLLGMLGMATAIAQHIGWPRVIRQQMEGSTRLQQMTPEQRAQTESMQLKVASITGYLGPIV